MEEAEIIPSSHTWDVWELMKGHTYLLEDSEISHRKRGHIIECVLELHWFFYLSFYKRSLITEQIFEVEMMFSCYIGRKPPWELNFIVQKNQSNKIQKVFSFLELLKFITSKKAHF